MPKWFSVMLAPKLLLTPIKIRIFGPKTAKFGPKYAFLVILGQALLAHLVSCWWVGWWLWCGLYLARHLFTLSSPSLFSLFFYYYRGGGGFIILLSLIRCFVHRTWGIGCSHFVEVILWLLVSNAFLMGSYIPKRCFLAFQRPWVVGSIGHEGWWRLLETFVYSSDSLYWRPDSL